MGASESKPEAPREINSEQMEICRRMFYASQKNYSEKQRQENEICIEINQLRKQNAALQAWLRNPIYEKEMTRQQRHIYWHHRHSDLQKSVVYCLTLLLKKIKKTAERQSAEAELRAHLITYNSIKKNYKGKYSIEYFPL